ncbi:MAG: type II toxin-antitoxin system RelE/ParE family toxin [Rickettsiales bacterium]|nr:type II toxin-antitoxin system RelE/ParE family toxin [Rickettsiales bacterium]
MIYKLTFLESAKKEWDKLAPSIRNDFKKKLLERLKNPIIPKDKLSGFKDTYKIKLRTVGYRLVYRVFEDRLTVQVVATGKRDKNLVYNVTKYRIE